MNIEIGKKYKTRGGWMATYLKDSVNPTMCLIDHSNSDNIKIHDKESGKVISGLPSDRAFDLIAPWEDEAKNKAVNVPARIEIIVPEPDDTAAIRRQYACAALTGLLSRQPNFAKDNEIAESYATASFVFADAMMKAERE